MLNKRQEVYDRAYKSEKTLISANGNNIHAVSLRFDNLKNIKQDLNEYIINKTIEILARENVLSNKLKELNEQNQVNDNEK